jgi:hypothetical protein
MHLCLAPDTCWPVSGGCNMVIGTAALGLLTLAVLAYLSYVILYPTRF